MDWSVIFSGIVIFILGILFNRLRDWLFVRRNRDGSYDSRYSRGSLMGTLMKLIGLLMIASEVFHLFH